MKLTVLAPVTGVYSGGSIIEKDGSMIIVGVLSTSGMKGGSGSTVVTGEVEVSVTVMGVNLIAKYDQRQAQ